MPILDSILAPFYSLARNVNKRRGDDETQETAEGVVSDKRTELELSQAKDKILKLTKDWEREWNDSKVKSEWEQMCRENERYWKGIQHDVAQFEKRRPHMDNVLFESLETYLPAATKQNPDPMVDPTREFRKDPEALAYASELQADLAEVAKKSKLRLKLKKAARHHAIYFVGIAKIIWDDEKNIPAAKIIRPQKAILDPDEVNDEDGYSGEWIGEHRREKAGNLLRMLEELGGEPEGMIYIKSKVGENLGTEIGFIEWSTDENVVWTIDNRYVLLKMRNPHFNWDPIDVMASGDVPTEEPIAPAIEKGSEEDSTDVAVEAMDTESGGRGQDDQSPTPNMPAVPDIGEPMPAQPPQNHFIKPKKPYILLTVFSLGTQPVDETNLMAQNLSGQDLVNKRLKQIDKNADSMNGGMVVSLERSGLTKDQAKSVTEARRRGGTVAIPTGSVADAIADMSAPGLPADVFNQLADTRNRIRDIYGVSGMTVPGQRTEKTVRGKMQNAQMDGDRIGGGISEYLELMAEQIYDYFIQMLYVYDERYIGNPNKPPVSVAIKPGSLIPKDSLTKANQAVDLAGQGKMSLLDLYKALDYPNPEEAAVNAWLEVNAPDVLYAKDPRVAQVMQARAAAAAKPPSESISFKDLPPEGKAQMAKQAGIELHPEAIAAHDEFKENAAAARAAAAKPEQPIKQ